MAQRGGGRSEWERRQAAARREAERATRERVRAEKEAEKRRKEQHVASQLRRAEQQCTELEQCVAQLDGILSDALKRSPLSFGDLVAAPTIPPFEPGDLAIAEPAPGWEIYAPMPPGPLGRMFGGTGRYERAEEEARDRYDRDRAAHEERESKRINALAQARSAHAAHARVLKSRRTVTVIS